MIIIIIIIKSWVRKLCPASRVLELGLGDPWFGTLMP